MMFGTFTAQCNTAARVEAGGGDVSVARTAGVMHEELYSNVPAHTITAPAHATTYINLCTIPSEDSEKVPAAELGPELSRS